ncbi:rab-GTPase-TBC domain-containing protein [Thamnidium elegans]|nr:rab-GTPase-TBC domain-containing protein [Thamnidium elegans]
MSAGLNKIPKNTFTLPTSTDNTLVPFWTIEQQNQYFMLQKSQEPGNTIFKSVLSTITNLFDAKQAPYRILFQREPNATCLQIAASDSEETIEEAWDWIKVYLLPLLEDIPGPYAKEEWIIQQMNTIVSSTITNNDTDDLLLDDIIRNASRTFRRTFNVSQTERLVNYYSCACNSRQGWVYISENYLAFYSYLLGFELKVLIELKDIKDIFKEPVRKLFRHSMRVTTKDNQEVYDLLVQLTGDSVHRLLKSSNSNAFKAESIDRSPSPAFDDKRLSDVYSSSPNNPLKNILQYRKKNETFRQLFRLPESEQVIDEISVCYMCDTDPDDTTKRHMSILVRKHMYPGTLYLSQNFLAFESSDISSMTAIGKSQFSFILPLYTVTRFERINDDHHKTALSLRTWHKMLHYLKVDAEKTVCEKFCESLKLGLEANIVKMKESLRLFLATCKSEELLQTPEGPIHIFEPIGGLGLQFGYKSDSTENVDSSKTQSWIKYFNENGRNLTLCKKPFAFTKLVRDGLPNALRGEIWEICSGSIYLRFANYGLYDSILESHKDEISLSMDDIEKDLHRSLPEYAAYQSNEGIDRLRRVLTAYSWKNPEIGYCQAMNIVTSSLLIYMTEEQAFWTLNTLVDHLCPGYYSSSMYGVLLDQVVLEKLVEKYIPKITEHFKEKEIQLSVACLPWFLTLFINSMPLPFAFRILDCFFMEGPKIIFQIALAVLKTHEKELCSIDDDSELLVVVKNFFASLNLPAGTTDQDYAKKYAIFKQLIASAYTDFGKVTSAKVNKYRKENELKIIGGVESFTKRNALRRIKNTANFGPDEISNIYDYFFGALYYAKRNNEQTEMDLTAFTKMIENMTTWAKPINVNSSDNSQNAQVIQEVSGSFIFRLFNYFKSDVGITLTDAVSKLGEILRGDILSKASFYFSLYNQDKSLHLNNEDLHTMATELFWLITTLEVNFDAWDTIRNFIILSAETSNSKQVVESLASVLTLDMNPHDSSYLAKHVLMIHNALMGPEAPVIEITLPSLRMIILTEDRLDHFIQTTFPATFKLEKEVVERQKGLGHEIFEALFIEGKKLANNMAYPDHLSPNEDTSSKRRSISSLYSYKSQDEEYEII